MSPLEPPREPSDSAELTPIAEGSDTSNGSTFTRASGNASSEDVRADSAPSVGTSPVPTSADSVGIDDARIRRVESELDQISLALRLLDEEGPEAVERMELFGASGGSE